MNDQDLKEVLNEFALPIVAILLIVASSLFFIIPKIKQIMALRTDIQKQTKQINQLSGKLSSLETLSQADLYESSNILLEALPQNKDFYKTISLVRQLCQQNNVQLESFKLSPGTVSTDSAQLKKKTGLSSLTVDIEFASSYENFSRLINEVDKMLPLVEIEGVKIGKYSASASSSAVMADLTGEMKLHTYYFPLPQFLGKVESPLPKISNEDNKLVEDLKSFIKYEPVAYESSEVIIGKDNPF